MLVTSKASNNSGIICRVTPQNTDCTVMVLSKSTNAPCLIESKEHVMPIWEKGAGLPPNLVQTDVTVEITKFSRVILIMTRNAATSRLHWTSNFKIFFVSVMNMLLIYLFVSMKLEKGHKKLLGCSFTIMLPL